jgi:tetratricopeptide (TPR) repeat protein
MVATTNLTRELARAKEFEPVVARVTSARASAPSKSAATAGGGGEPAPLAKKILLSDDLIRQRKFVEARAMLEEILAVEPNNARAIYGMAQTVSQIPSPAELDSKADEDDKIQAQYDRLEQAVKLYRKAIERASKDTERWLIQWSHVLIGRIRDFQEFRADAIAEYEKAIALGELQNGAYKEALEGKQKPFGQK